MFEVLTDRELMTAYLVAVAALVWAKDLEDAPSVESCESTVLELGGMLTLLGYDPTDVVDIQRRLA